MKKEVISKLLIIFSIIVLTGFISAEGCEIRLRTNCQTAPWDNIVMGLSSLTNAHGEFPDVRTYNYVLCCDFGAGDNFCTGANKIIGLSSDTNAHAEIPDAQEPNYDIDVCYDGLNCISTIEGCNEDYSMEVLTISDWTNAHIGDYGRYICCHHLECRNDETPGEINFCGDYYEEECEYDPCGVADISVESNSPNITCGEGYICVCELMEGACVPTYEAVQEPGCGNNIIDSELGETCDGTDMPFTDCSGNVDDCSAGTVSCYAPGHENECTLDASECTGCVEGGECGDGIIQSPNNNGTYETCDTNNLNSKTCEDFSLVGTGLACYSPTHANNCTFDTTACEPDESNPSKIGKCTYNETTDDNCDDGFLTYSFIATWIWDESNPEHYDPNNAAGKCVDDSTTIPCPAQIELPFFGSYSIVIIISLIALVYVFLKFKEKEKLKKKSGSKSKKK